MTARFTIPVAMEAEMVQAVPAASTGKAHSITTWVVLFLKGVLAIAVVGLLLAKTGAGAVFDTLRLVPLSALLLACMLTALQPLLGALRWHLIMRFLGGALTIAQTVRAFWLGAFASALLPGGLTGDGVRMWILLRAGLRPSKSVNSVLLDRGVALLGLLLLVASSLPFLDDRIADTPVRYGASALLIAGMLLGLMLAMVVRVPARWQHVRALRAVLHLSKDLRAICLVPTRLLCLIGISALATLCNALTIFLLFRALHVEIGFMDVMVLSPLVILVLTVPLSIGGWGLREASMVGLFALVGVPTAVSLSVSILSGLLATLVTLPGALVRLR